jgi:hypothetical protein
MIFIPHRKHTCGPPPPVTAIAFLFICMYVCIIYMMSVLHKEKTYGIPLTITGIAFLFYFWFFPSFSNVKMKIFITERDACALCCRLSHTCLSETSYVLDEMTLWSSLVTQAQTISQIILQSACLESGPNFLNEIFCTVTYEICLDSQLSNKGINCQDLFFVLKSPKYRLILGGCVEE